MMRTNGSLVACSVLSVAACGVAARAGSVTVSFEPSASVVTVGNTVSVDLIATIDEAEVSSWAVDVSYDDSLVSLMSSAVDPQWTDANGTGDGEMIDLAALAFPGPIGDPSGTMDVALATFELEADAAGVSSLVAFADDAGVEGFFGVDPNPFDGDPAPEIDTTYEDGLITVLVPLPTPVALAGAGLLAVGVWRRRA